MKLAPSILSADLADLTTALAQCRDGGASLIHFDVMDGHFVPNLTFGIPVLESVVRHSELPVDVHLMVEDPDALLDAYLDAGAAQVSVHYEAARHLDRTLNRIREKGARCGVALNPATPAEALTEVLEALDFVVVMSVNPGFSGQPFLPYTLKKTRRLKRMAQERGTTLEVEMDGGLGRDTIRSAVKAGADICVAGSAVFGTPDPVKTMGELRRRALGDEA